MRKVKNAAVYIVLILASLISVFPLYWMIAAATNNSTDILGGKLTIGANLASNLTNLLARQQIGRAFSNSMFYSVILSVLSLLICSIAGYAFEIYHDKAKDVLMSVLLLAMMVPFAATLIPLFKMFTGLHLQSTWIAYVLPTLSTPFLIMMFRQSARSFPTEIIEAARIDGLGELQIFFKIFMPTMKSTYAAAMTVTFMNAWNNYLWPKVIMMDDTSQTIALITACSCLGYSSVPSRPAFFSWFCRKVSQTELWGLSKDNMAYPIPWVFRISMKSETHGFYYSFQTSAGKFLHEYSNENYV